jgi:hypothetical protein
VNIRAVYRFSFTKICEKELCIATCHLVFPVEYSKLITLVFNNIVLKKEDRRKIKEEVMEKRTMKRKKLK